MIEYLKQQELEKDTWCVKLGTKGRILGNVTSNYLF